MGPAWLPGILRLIWFHQEQQQNLLCHVLYICLYFVIPIGSVDGWMMLMTVSLFGSLHKHDYLISFSLQLFSPDNEGTLLVVLSGLMNALERCSGKWAQ